MSHDDDDRLFELLDLWEDLQQRGLTLTPAEMCGTRWGHLIPELTRRIHMLRYIDKFLAG